MFCYLKEQPENPCEKCEHDKYCVIKERTEPSKYFDLCMQRVAYKNYQSIISKLVEVNLNAMRYAYQDYRTNNRHVYPESKLMDFEQFIQQQIQEGKDGTSRV